MALSRRLPLISDRPLARAGLNSERVLWPTKGPGVFEEEIASIEDALSLTTVEKAVAWLQSNSVWPDTFGLACCAMEMISIVGSHHDVARFGMEKFSSSPRQADLLIVSGTVFKKIAPVLLRLYEQMAEPRYVISMGSCSNSGGPYCQHGYGVVKGVDQILPVDVYIPGCPPRPEALIDGYLKLRELIERETMAKQG